MSALAPIDSTILQTVTGGTAKGGSSSSSGIDSLLAQLNAMTGSINDVKNKTSGLDSGSMLILCMLAMQRNNGVVYVGQRPGCWW
jgi:hypothetical protein